MVQEKQYPKVRGETNTKDGEGAILVEQHKEPNTKKHEKLMNKTILNSFTVCGKNGDGSVIVYGIEFIVEQFILEYKTQLTCTACKCIDMLAVMVVLSGSSCSY